MALRIFIPIFAGALCALGVLIPHAWLCVLIGIPLFLYGLHHRMQGPNGSVFWYGYTFGIVFLGGVLLWFWSALPLDWLNLGPVSGFVLVFGSWIIIIAPLALTYGCISSVFANIRTGTAWDAGLFSALWVLSEYTQMWIFSLITWNTESLVGAHFSAISIGYAAASFSPLLQVASVGGIHLLTFLLVCIGALVYSTIAQTTLGMRAKILVAAVCVALFAILTIVDQKNPLVTTRSTPANPKITVAVVSSQHTPSIPRSVAEARERSEEVRAAIRAWGSANEAPHILILPEGGRGDELSQTEAEELLRDAFAGKPVSIVDSGIVLEENVFSARMFIRDTTGRPRAIYEKIFLVPQGEYTPRLAELAMQLPGGTRLRENIKRAERSYTRGQSLFPIELEGARIGALFCSDVLSPTLYKRLARSDAAVLINASSLAALHGSKIVDNAFLNFAKVRAAENGRFLIIASHAAPASIISDKGTVLARTQNTGITILSYNVPLIKTQTLYTRFGSWILLCSIAILLTAVLRRRSFVT